MNQRKQTGLLFEHPPMNLGEKRWVQVRRPGSPIYKDAQFKVWAFRRGEEFHREYYATKYGYDSWFLSFRRGVYHGKYNVRAFGYGLLDYFLRRGNFASYIERKNRLKSEINEMWSAYDFNEVRRLNTEEQIALIERAQKYMMRAFGVDVPAPMIGEIAPEYLDWWLERRKVPEDDRSNLLHRLLAGGMTSETVKRQLEIRRQLDAVGSIERREAVKAKLLREYAHTRSEIAGYVPFLESDLLEEYHAAAKIRLQPQDEALRQKQLLHDLGATEQERKVVELFSYFQYNRDERKEYVQKLITLIDWCLAALSGRYDVSVPLLRNALCGEVTDYNLCKAEYKDLLRNRFDAGLVMGFSNEEDGRYFLGDDGLSIFEAVDKGAVRSASDGPSASELAGNSAYGGIVVGRVRIVHDPSESIDEENFILVTGMTSPNFIHLMHRCAAILTDEGGITCHAAILARELKKPCIVGLGRASLILNDGELIKVDAERGVVIRL